MSRITSTEQAIGRADQPAVAVEPSPAPRKPSKSDAAKADVVTETEETP